MYRQLREVSDSVLKIRPFGDLAHADAAYASFKYAGCSFRHHSNHQHKETAMFVQVYDVNNPEFNPFMGKRHKRGFTLTEIAIVLGIIGLILGAIWGAASSVYSNKKTANAEQGITATAQAVRSMFATSGSTGAGAALVTTLAVPGMFPVSWINSSGGVSNPWSTANGANGFSYVVGTNVNTSLFGVELDGISGAGCAGLINYFSSAASSVNGGQVTGLVGAFWVTGAPTAGTSKVNTAPSATYATAVASSCVTTAAGTAGTSGNNNFMVAFDMSKM